MFRRFLFSVFCAAMPALAASAANAQVANGGFEAPVTPPGSFTLYTPDAPTNNIGGFTVFGPQGSNVATISTTFNDFAGVNNARSGLAFLDLTGSIDNGLKQGVYQNVATVAGQKYTLTFYIGHQYTDNNPTIVGVSTTGFAGSYTEFTNGNQQGNSAASIVYQAFTLDFTASSASTQIAFRNDQLGLIRSAALDDISLAPAAVVAVPGPLAGAGLVPLFGLAGAYVVGRRRRPAA